MNERIRELYKNVLASSENMRWNIEDAEKFAELIVRECLGDFKNRIATRYQGSEQDRNIGYGMEIVYFDIIDKFGVEE